MEKHLQALEGLTHKVSRPRPEACLQALSAQICRPPAADALLWPMWVLA